MELAGLYLLFPWLQMATKPGWELFSLQGLVPELSRGWRAAEQDGAGGNLPHQTAGAVGQKLHGTGGEMLSKSKTRGQGHKHVVTSTKYVMGTPLQGI